MRVNEIFYSIQGEGAHTGQAVIFIRLSGCNLKCDFCDTKHQAYKELTEDEICAKIAIYGANTVIITGGEPTLQLTESLIDKIHALGKSVCIETNGTRPVPRGVDWVTVSPKAPFVGDIGKPVITIASEVKIVLDDLHIYDEPTFGIKAEHYFVQPCDTGNPERNKKIIDRCINFVKNNPKWKISLQTQKILNVR